MATRKAGAATAARRAREIFQQKNIRGSKSLLPSHLSLKLQTGKPMYYVYILYSPKSDGFYFGLTPDVKSRIQKHNQGKVLSIRPYRPWQLIWYARFADKRLATDFELYLKSGSGKAFAYKRLIQSGVSRKMGGNR